MGKKKLKRKIVIRPIISICLLIVLGLTLLTIDVNAKGTTPVDDKARISCASITYGSSFEPKVDEFPYDNATTTWWYYDIEDKNHVKEWNSSEPNPPVGTYMLYAVFKPKIGWGECRSDEIKVTVSQAEPEYPAPNVSAFCGTKLADINLDQPDNGKFEWVNNEQIIKAGENLAIARFIPTDTKNYKTIEKIEITVAVNHDDKNKLAKPDKVEATDEVTGMYEHYECPTCKAFIGMDGKTYDKSHFVIPYVEKNIDVIIGDNELLGGFVITGEEGVESVEIKDSKKYEKYIIIDEEKNIAPPEEVQYYPKKKLGTPVLLVKDHMGNVHKSKIHLWIRKPAKFKVGRKELQGGKIYRYTLECEAKYADNITIEATKGLVNEATRKKLNEILKQKIEDKVKESKKKSKKKVKVKIVFTATKRAIKDDITFKARAEYGKNISQPFVKKYNNKNKKKG